jgi:hypothetical protein
MMQQRKISSKERHKVFGKGDISLTFPTRSYGSIPYKQMDNRCLTHRYTAVFDGRFVLQKLATKQ